MLCLNPRCPNQPRSLGEHFFGAGYCCRDCWHDSQSASAREGAEPLLDPTDPTGQREIARNLDEVDAMLEAMEVDRRLPRIIYLLRGKMTKVAAASECHMPESTLRHILCSCDGKLLRRCGLRTV